MKQETKGTMQCMYQETRVDTSKEVHAESESLLPLVGLCYLRLYMKGNALVIAWTMGAGFAAKACVQQGRKGVAKAAYL